MSDHGNSHKNMNPYNLYGIFEHETKDALKYGITDDPIEADGLPYRARMQTRLANIAAGFLKFFARVLLTNLPRQSGGGENRKGIHRSIPKKTWTETAGKFEVNAR